MVFAIHPRRYSATLLLCRRVAVLFRHLSYCVDKKQATPYLGCISFNMLYQYLKNPNGECYGNRAILRRAESSD